jgi:hypothetical protein
LRRSSALLAAAALALSVFAVPGTAQADATGVILKLDFDRLAKDRVLKLTLNAESASGVTNVRAKLRYQTPEAEPYATVEFRRTSGTDNDGVWQADYRPDIETRPGATLIEVLIVTADGATLTRQTGFYDCYTTSITGFSNSPDVIDFEHSDLTMSGKVMVQKYREAAPEPVQGATVTTQTENNSATTGADGSFTLKTSGDNIPMAQVPRQGQLCFTYQPAAVTVEKQATQITATMTPASTVAPYTNMDVDGKVVRMGSAGPVPLANAGVQVNASAEVAYSTPLWVKTAADGTFHTSFTAGRNAGASAAVTAHYYGAGFLAGTETGLGALTIKNTATLTDFNAFPEPLAYGDTVIANGRLTIEPDLNNSTNLPLYLEYSFDRKTWKTWATQTLARQGNVYFNTDRPVTADAYWRIRYPGDAFNIPAVTEPDYVDVKYRTQMYDFNASPEPVKKGGTITVKGLLYRFRAKAEPGPNANIHIYFKPKGSSTWTKMAITKTASNGWFKKTFRASQDGTWLARYWESAGYLGSNYPSDYVDVK